MCKYLAMAAMMWAALILSSCTEDGTGYGSMRHGQITARIDNGAATRTAVGDAVEGADAVGIVWTDGDEIGVFDASGAVQKRYAKVGQGTAAIAAFDASGTAAFGKPAYAYYRL